jgi:copper chaperone CopZ
MSTAIYNVVGMNCGHCVESVTKEMSKLPGVMSVVVDLPTGAVTVESAVPLDAAAVASAIDEAGFDLAT